MRRADDDSLELARAVNAAMLASIHREGDEYVLLPVTHWHRVIDAVRVLKAAAAPRETGECLGAELEQAQQALRDSQARLDIALGVFDDHDEARIDFESLVEEAEDRAALRAAEPEEPQP
jgi:hypothetical protein